MHSIFLVTAALIGLPILLHLIMKQEPKRLIFPAIRFLQQKQKTNQRKLRLRHWLLLALRMLLIGLFGWTLYQPFLSGDLGGVQLGGEQPVAAVFILDTSPSMGYVANDRSRLAEAVRRATELLDELPPGSKVALVNPADPLNGWELSLGDARKKLETFKEPLSVARPVTDALATAYQLLRTVDQESESAEPLPRLLVVFSDRMTNCWDATRLDDLKKLRDSIPEPAVSPLFVDVGLDTPTNVAITSATINPQIQPAGKPVLVNATLTSTGADVEASVRCRLMGEAVPEQKKLVKLANTVPTSVSFTLDGTKLSPGIQHVEISLETPDKLECDNVRFVTFRVAEPRRILTLTDDLADAEIWSLAHDAAEEFRCEVRSAAGELPNLRDYESVTLLNVADPAALWPKLWPYVEAGGKLLLLPGPSAKVTAYQATNELAVKLLPGTLGKRLDTANNRELTDPRYRGVVWVIDEPAMRQGFLSPFREWKLRGNVDFVVNPPRATNYWEITPTPEGRVMVAFDDEDDPKTRRPAVLERSIGPQGGQVMLLASSLHKAVPTKPEWNDYFKSSWAVVLPNRLMRYLCGDPALANFNFLAGQPVVLNLPKTGIAKGAKAQLEGRGITGRDGTIELNENQVELRLSASQTAQAGHFTVTLAPPAPPATPAAPIGKDGFSLNAPAEESTLTKLPEATIEELFGPGSVVPVSKDVKLKDLLTLRWNQPIDLFPWLVMVVVLGVAGEAWFANRFYRR